MTQTPTAPTAPASTTTPNKSPNGAVTDEMLSRFRREFETNRANRIAQNAVTKTTIDDIALDRSIVTGMTSTFSHRLDDWEVTNQKKSGRCWMFAGLNLFRVGAMKKMNLEKFEFSQNYTLFWDKFERANYFLNAIIESSDRPVDDRAVAYLLDRPLDDGGQWNMFINVIKKHGVVPQAVMPETESSSNTRRMNSNLLHKLREGAMKLRNMRANDAPMEAALAKKNEILDAIYRMLCIHLGTPPQTFDWQWRDKDKMFHRDGEMTPQEFAEKYITLPIDEYVCLVHDPRETSPVGKTFTVEFLGNVVGGDIVTYLNVDMNTMKDIAKRTIMDGEPVWFGCDVGKMMQRDMGLWDAELFDYASIYNTEFTMKKADRLVHHHTLMTHAMLFTGVDVVNDDPRRWRVENSWGDDSGEKGYYIMNDSWFDEHMFEIAARKKYLSPELQQALEQEPQVLPPWDPMGALAR